VTRLWLVRHGRAASGWDMDPDPDLDEVGLAQAEHVAQRLAVEASGAAVFTSPLLRCRSTALALTQRFGIEAEVRQEIAEVPSPQEVAMADRVEWLGVAMQGTWANLGADYVEFRDNVVRFVRDCETDAVLFTHFIAINAVIGAITGDDRVVVRRLANCSVTILDRHPDSSLQMIVGGDEADTAIR